MSLSELADALGRALPSQAERTPTHPRLWLADVTMLARELVQMPTAYISVSDSTTTRFLAVQGERLAPAPRESTLCDLVAMRGATVVVADASADPALAAYPAVRAGLHSYVGAPMSEHGSSLSVALCVADQLPRPDVHEKVHLLEGLARIAGRAFTA